MDIGIILAIFGLMLSIGIAIWQNSKAKKAEEKLDNFLHNMPTQIFDNVSRLLLKNDNEAHDLYALFSSGKSFHSECVDLNGDGEEELAIYYPFGPYGTALQVFGFMNRRFSLLAELIIDTPSGFVFGDKDGDGRLETVVHEVSHEADMPYVMGFRDEVWYRLESNRFVEVKRIKLYSSDELEEAHRNPEKRLK
ncbi:MAG TPA: hypothetical protein VJ550_11245 [Geomonas sp.]|nr:hypothetical protein [Geomonas sp.]